MRSVADSKAAELAPSYVEQLREERPAEREGLLKFLLEDALTHHFYDTLKALLRDEQGSAYIRTLGALMAARSNANARAVNSTKAKFLEWATEEVARNPTLSKNALASSYAREHPGVSVATLRRYITGPAKGMD